LYNYNIISLKNLVPIGISANNNNKENANGVFRALVKDTKMENYIIFIALKIM